MKTVSHRRERCFCQWRVVNLSVQSHGSSGNTTCGVSGTSELVLDRGLPGGPVTCGPCTPAIATGDVCPCVQSGIARVAAMPRRRSRFQTSTALPLADNAVKPILSMEWNGRASHRPKARRERRPDFPDMERPFLPCGGRYQISLDRSAMRPYVANPYVAGTPAVRWPSACTKPDIPSGGGQD